MRGHTLQFYLAILLQVAAPKRIERRVEKSQVDGNIGKLTSRASEDLLDGQWLEENAEEDLLFRKTEPYRSRVEPIDEAIW